MRHIYAFHNYDISEEMLLGLGAGVSFSYWHFKGTTPFLGGRGGFKPPLEEVAARRTGVGIQMQTTSSQRRAQERLLGLLEAGQPVMIQCDMGFLPYFDFGGQEYHFGGHVVVVCGYGSESGHVLIADRDEDLHPVPMQALVQARASTYRPFPPKNLWYEFDFCGQRPPTADEVRQAIREMVQPMLQPPIRNIGVPGMRKAAQAVSEWPNILSQEELRGTLFNASIFITAVGGTGGGCFRYMLSRFLEEAAGKIGEPGLVESAEAFRAIGDRWEELGRWFEEAADAADPAAVLGEATAALEELAGLEEAAWKRLGAWV
jgi:hypothetical protein